MKPGFFPITIIHKEYRFRKRTNNQSLYFSKSDIIKYKQEAENRKIVLAEQEKGKKEHFARQQPDVRKRMKQSFKESAKARGEKSSLERFSLLIKNNSSEKNKYTKASK